MVAYVIMTTIFKTGVFKLREPALNRSEAVRTCTEYGLVSRDDGERGGGKKMLKKKKIDEKKKKKEKKENSVPASPFDTPQ